MGIACGKRARTVSVPVKFCEPCPGRARPKRRVLRKVLFVNLARVCNRKKMTWGTTIGVFKGMLGVLTIALITLLPL